MKVRLVAPLVARKSDVMSSLGVGSNSPLGIKSLLMDRRDGR